MSTNVYLQYRVSKTQYYFYHDALLCKHNNCRDVDIATSHTDTLPVNIVFEFPYFPPSNSYLGKFVNWLMKAIDFKGFSNTNDKLPINNFSASTKVLPLTVKLWGFCQSNDSK